MPFASPQDGRTRLQHELKNPLAIILGRAQSLQGALSAHPGFSAPELARLLASLGSIKQQVHVLVIRIDAVQSVTYPDVEADG